MKIFFAMDNNFNEYISYIKPSTDNVKCRNEKYIIDIINDYYKPVTDLENRQWYFNLAIL